ncbi:hypothetical protein TTHERM_00649350 (macronuclear) [Tetrahymena thermophila SB210]|uniref:Uncharacterized protein n=1 Tax=Tetrahymena thermophila (strain SB210) TaxID=312017 RepID=I7MCR1_TETTS|nr:hypothetical protein TTHERM_00649350 [Tetrahymena thermophila SB210]EAR84666.1 hypothetical protein TTHERM_00649350 [Tetrahymena thermophila SB210]|eukprot:XP_001032329.1 hypothetical protein TTHERM_00649350 [Tetrahymena thermophila SB210]
MNKRSSRQSSKCEEILTYEEEIPLESISKKLFKSQNQTKITNSTRNTEQEDTKEHVKMSLKDLKNLKNLRKTQEKILINIENENIQNHVQELLQKFDSPFCGNCLKRRADKICVNKHCGIERYMQLICGKCHQDEHQKSVKKSEIDIEEYFIKLAKFLNEQKYNEKLNNQKIDIDNLDTIFDEIDNFRQKLDYLKQKIQCEIESYVAPQGMQAELQNTIVNALSLFQNQNIQEQLNKMKNSIIFSKNKFIWNDAIQKFSSFAKVFKDLEDIKISTNKKISKSFIGGFNIDLSQIVTKICPQLSSSDYGNNSQKEIKVNDQGEIKISSNNPDYETQYYIDLPLQKEKKYIIRFRFDQNIADYLYIGVIKKSVVEFYGVTQTNINNFYIAFQDESYNIQVVKGSNLSYICQQGLKIEMRIDLENNYIDYYDYPEVKNINAINGQFKFSDEEYVLAFYFSNSHITIENIQEVSSFEQIT